jgi:DNA repair exonuclease SbcCD ATPase subunit
MNETLFQEVGNNVPSLGRNEFNRALKVLNSKDVRALTAEINQYRDSFIGVNNSLGNAIMLPAEEWTRVRREAEEASKRELMTDSPALAEVDELQRKANEALAKAKAKQNELNRLWNEFQQLPQRYEQLADRLSTVVAAKSRLEWIDVSSEFKDLYKHALLGTAVVAGDALSNLAYTATTRAWQLEALTEVESELTSAIAVLKRSNADLAKKIGTKAHQFSKP